MKKWGYPMKKVRCIETGEVYPSLQAAARANKMSASNLCRLVKYNIPGICGGYHWEVVDVNIDPFPKYEIAETGDIFPTLAEVGKALGVSKQAIHQAIRKKMRVKGHRVREVWSEVVADEGSL